MVSFRSVAIFLRCNDLFKAFCVTFISSKNELPSFPGRALNRSLLLFIHKFNLSASQTPLFFKNADSYILSKKTAFNSSTSEDSAFTVATKASITSASLFIRVLAAFSLCVKYPLPPSLAVICVIKDFSNGSNKVFLVNFKNST